MENGQKILIVDDEAVNLKLLKAHLVPEGYGILEAKSGEEALRAAQNRPDLVLLDVMMPGLDGIETCRLLKADEATKDIPVIFLSGLQDTRTKTRGLEAGGVDFVSKPFDPRELLARVRAHLTIKAQERQLREYAVRLEEMVEERTGQFIQSEQRFRTLAEATFEGIALTEDGRILDANDQLAEMLGCNREELVGRFVSEFIAPEARELVLQVQRERKTERYEHLMLRKNGTPFPAEIRARYALIGNREVRVTAIRDMSEHKRAEEEKEKLETQLFQAQKMEAIGTLAGGIAHDFNNILSAILGYAELTALALVEGSKAKYNLEQSMKAAHRAKDLVQQILAFSRQGKQDRKVLNIKPIIKEGLKFLRASLPSTIEIHQDIEEDVGPIEADPTQIHQIIMNLCTNAAHAMAETGGVLNVSLGNLDQDVENTTPPAGIVPGPYVRLRVSDTGHGMPPEILRRIFDPYFTTKEPGKGTGLGLAVVHGIVKSYGGEIKVSSEVGKGATFDIYFQRVETSTAPLTGYEGESALLTGHERVLFVDDEMAIVETSRESLEYLGYEVVARTSSIEALELFRAEPGRFDLVITDMTMPNMTGDKLAQELLKIRPNVPIILCTGFSEQITEERAGAIGIREYMMKPMAMKELAKAMRRVLESQP